MWNATHVPIHIPQKRNLHLARDSVFLHVSFTSCKYVYFLSLTLYKCSIHTVLHVIVCFFFSVTQPLFYLFSPFLLFRLESKTVLSYVKTKKKNVYKKEQKIPKKNTLVSLLGFSPELYRKDELVRVCVCASVGEANNFEVMYVCALDIAFYLIYIII